jgi:hypothetical protein
MTPPPTDAALGRSLFDGLLRAGLTADQQSASKMPIPRLEKWPVSVIAGLLLLFGLLLLGVSVWLGSDDAPTSQKLEAHAAKILSGVAEAFMIAGALGLTIEAAMRRKFVREIVSDIAPVIFYHRFPDRIINAIRSVAVSPLVRGNLLITFALTRNSSGSLDVQVTWAWDVYNYGDSVESYRPPLAYDEIDKVDPQSVEVVVRHEGRETVARGSDFGLTNKAKPQAVVKEKMIKRVAEQVFLKPQKKGDSTPACHVIWNYKMVGAPTDYRDIYTFTMKTDSVKVSAPVRPDDIEFSCESESKSDYNWYFPKVFLEGEGIKIRWWPKSPPAAEGSEQPQAES